MSDRPSESKGGAATLSEKPSSTMAQPSVEEEDGGQSTTEQLLEGVGVIFSDYQDCMDEDTMDKWKQVL